MAIKPPKLKENANIRIVAPASPPDLKVLSTSINLLKKYGFNVSLGENIRKLVQRADLAAPDKNRADELNQAFKDPTVDAIFCARGGYGSMRILSLLDYDAIRANPKIFVGYSDITALHLAIHKNTNMITFHGPMPGADADEMKKPSFQNFLKVLKGESDNITTNINRVIKYIVPGKTEGISEGTNISLFASLIGTDYIPDARNRIAFFEDIATTSGDVDRYLFRLKLAIPWILEFLLKARRSFHAHSWGILQKNGRLTSPHGRKIYSLTHLFLRTGKFKEWQIVQMFTVVEIIIAAIALFVAW